MDASFASLANATTACSLLGKKRARGTLWPPALPEAETAPLPRFLTNRTAAAAGERTPKRVATDSRSLMHGPLLDESPRCVINSTLRRASVDFGRELPTTSAADTSSPHTPARGLLPPPARTPPSVFRQGPRRSPMVAAELQMRAFEEEEEAEARRRCAFWASDFSDDDAHDDDTSGTKCPPLLRMRRGCGKVLTEEEREKLRSITESTLFKRIDKVLNGESASDDDDDDDDDGEDAKEDLSDSSTSISSSLSTVSTDSSSSSSDDDASPSDTGLYFEDDDDDDDDDEGRTSPPPTFLVSYSTD